MARATDLPIYRAAYDLLKLVTKLTQQYPRNYRQGLARDVFTEAMALVKTIFHANCVTGPGRVPLIQRADDHLETLRLMLRLSKDLHLISVEQFGDTVILTSAVGKQAEGWLKYARSRA